eukprot:152605_1
MATSSLQTSVEMQSEWRNLCRSKNHGNIVSYFDLHKEEILCGSSWFLEDLIRNDDIKSIQYIFQQTNPLNYINVKPNQLRTAMYSTFELIRLLVSNGAKFPDDVGASIIGLNLFYNSKMTPEEIYLCVEYLLTNLNGEIKRCLDVLIYLSRMDKTKESFDPIKMAKLIKSKRQNFQKILKNAQGLSYAVGSQNFKFAEYMIDNGAILTPELYIQSGRQAKYGSNDIIIKWLVKHNVNINEEIKYYQYTGTPLFQCVIDKRYDMMQLLLNNGADINKQCKYNNKVISSLELCKETFSAKHFEYFRNY